MVWSYSPSLPTEKDRVRLLIGDTDINEQQFQDEEIELLISQYGDRAAEVAILALAAKYSRLADKEVGELKLKLHQKAQAYQKLAKEFATSVSEAISRPIFIDQGEFLFTKGMMENK